MKNIRKNRTLIKKPILLLLIFTLIFGCLALTGCENSDATNNNANANNDVELTGWEYISEKGELVVGLDDTFAPMGFRDEQGELVGFDIDLANAVASELGIEISFSPIDWDAKELELSSKRIDCIWNGMSATKKRQEDMALTDKYLNNRIVLLAKDETIVIQNESDLNNYKIGTQSDSSALEAIVKNPSYEEFKNNIVEYKTYDEAILDMQAGRIDVIAVDQVLGEYKNSKMKNKMTLCEYDFGDDYYAIGCRKGETDLADKINEALNTLIENGEAAKISEKWFGKDIVILEGYEEN